LSIPVRVIILGEYYGKYISTIRDRVEVPQEKYVYVCIYLIILFIFSCGISTRSRIMDFLLRKFRDHTQWTYHIRQTSVGKSSAQNRDLYLTPQNTQKRPTSMPPAGQEPAIPASQRLQTHALDCAATGIGHVYLAENIRYMKCWISSILVIICLNDATILNTVLKIQ